MTTDDPTLGGLLGPRPARGNGTVPETDHPHPTPPPGGHSRPAPAPGSIADTALFVLTTSCAGCEPCQARARTVAREYLRLIAGQDA